MAIATIDGVIAGMQYPRFWQKATTVTVTLPRCQSTWASVGIPGAGSYDTTLNGVTLSGTSSQVSGQIPFTDPVSGNTYLNRFAAQASVDGTLLLCDRLWHNGGYTITSTSAQNSTSPTWPARDTDGASSGNGVYLALEISSAAGAAAPTITVAYTNSAGTASRSATNLDTTANSPAAGAMYRIALQAGDVGVQSVQSVTLNTSWLSGTMNLVAYRILSQIDITTTTTGGAAAADMFSMGFPRMYNGTVPYIVWIPNVATGPKLEACVQWTQG